MFHSDVQDDDLDRFLIWWLVRVSYIEMQGSGEGKKTANGDWYEKLDFNPPSLGKIFFFLCGTEMDKEPQILPENLFLAFSWKPGIFKSLGMALVISYFLGANVVKPKSWSMVLH